MSYECPFCKPKETFSSQLLLVGRHFYMIAPKGQMVEGYIFIAPFYCQSPSHYFGCFAHIRQEQVPELRLMRKIVGDFYQSCYGGVPGIYYEQGKAGAGDVWNPSGRFRYHAHFCCFPLALNLHPILSQKFPFEAIDDYGQIPVVARDMPYWYVECLDASGVYVKRIYDVSGTDYQEHTFIRPIIAQEIGLPERANWRNYVGDAEIEATVAKFAAWFEGYRAHPEAAGLDAALLQGLTLG